MPNFEVGMYSIYPPLSNPLIIGYWIFLCSIFRESSLEGGAGLSEYEAWRRVPGVGSGLRPQLGIILIRRLAEKDLAYSYLLALFTTSSVFSFARRRTPVILWN